MCFMHAPSFFSLADSLDPFFDPRSLHAVIFCSFL